MRSVLVPAALAASVLVSSAQAAVLLGVASYTQFGVQSLYRIDSVTGAATLIGSTGISRINGITFDTSTGTLWAYTTNADLYKLDVNTGAATLFGAQANTIPEGDITYHSPGLAYVTNGGELGRIAITSGAYTPVGQMGLVADDVSGLEVDDDGSLLGYSKNGTGPDTLIRINPASGVASLIGLTGVSSPSAFGGLALDSATGALFMTDGERLYTVDRFSGAATLIGAHGPTAFSGLEVIPAPAGVGLLAAAGLLAARRRRA